MRYKILDDFAIDFLKNHFDELDLERLGWKVKSLSEAIEEVEDDECTAHWVIADVMCWGSNKNYLEEFIEEVEDEGLGVLVKIKNRYFIFSSDPPYEVEKFIITKEVFKRKE